MTTSWKQWLTSAESNSRHIGANAHQTAVAVRNLWKSKEFLAEACDNRLDDLASKLSVFSGRFGLGLNDMIQMINHFPDEKDWKGGRLDVLRDKTCKLLMQQQPARPDGKLRKVVKRSEYQELQNRYQELQGRFHQLEAENKRLHKALQGMIRGREVLAK